MVNVLVTGGAGYIGSRLVPRLLKENYEVTVLDNFMYGQSSLLECCSDPNFSVVRGDCRDEVILKSLVEKADVIIPLAALVGFPLCDKDKLAAVSTNFQAIQSILQRRSLQQRILVPCTNSGYGIGSEGKYCTEETPMNPISLYGKTKVQAEKAIMDSGNAVSFRLATVFGCSSRMRTDLLVNDFTYRAVNDGFVVVFDGHASRNYIHILDVVNAFMYALSNWDNMKDQVYNVGLSDANLSKLELCERIKRQIPKFVYMEAEVGEDPDKRDYLVDNSKIESTGWKPQYGLDEGIRELIKAYQIIKNNKYGNV